MPVVRFPPALSPRRIAARPRILFAFPAPLGRSSSFGHELLREESIFRDAVSALRPLTEDPEVLSTVALQCALVELLRAWGVTPSGVVGEGAGEVAAQLAAGGIDLAGARAVGHTFGRTPFPSPALATGPRDSASPPGAVLPRPECPVYSAMCSGRLPAGSLPDEDYWRGVQRLPPRLDACLDEALADGYDAILTFAPGDAGDRILALLEAKRPPSPVFALAASGPGERARVRAACEAIRRIRPLGPHGPEPGPESSVAGGDPHRRYIDLHARGVLATSEGDRAWLLLGYETVSAALRDPEVFASTPATGLDSVLLGADPPAHTQVRRILTPYFSPAAIRSIESEIEARARGLWRQGEETGEFDILHDFAQPLSEYAAARAIGLNPEQLLALQAADKAGRIDIDQRIADLSRFFSDLVRAPPAENGLLRDVCENFSAEQAVSLLRGLWIAASVTAALWIAVAIHWLLRRPDALARLRADATRVPIFLDEILRFDPPVFSTLRQTTREIEVAGVRLPQGALVRLSIAAANRDPAQFQHPEALIPDRQPNAHLTFGLGAHFCLGRGLAIAEARIALGVFLSANRGVRPVLPLNRIRYLESPYFRAIESLRVVPG